MFTFLSTPSARRATRLLKCMRLCLLYFYPRPPRGGRPRTSYLSAVCAPISIHALREEGDDRVGVRELQAVQISIHALREEGDGDSFTIPRRDRVFLSTPSARRATASSRSSMIAPSEFLSTPSARRATPEISYYGMIAAFISIHALREEGDPRKSTQSNSNVYFYPRPPRGGRQQKQRQNLYFQTNYTTFCTNLEEP